MTALLATFDPRYDLKLEREIDVPVDLVWRAWTTPAHLRQWFVPKPWTIADCEIDLRPGGIFRTVMRSPEGEEHDNSGCFLDVVHHERLVFTDTLLPGFRPSAKPFFTGALLLAPLGSGTRYTAFAIHGDAETRDSHEKMGFHDGWGTVATQMVDYIKSGAL
ncbi:SRPBCC family protein [Starkeya koreensis]|uniref:SRPBCC family protein n=1 Tax=Ancylobacter koreensis TaxID=266121 RepID=A0ABT0DN47_9HYPH|nr:SRPBCC family protein [Ancylobacter koreensis]MCK0208685.1 SRPBCC family protein [Ancylobacter koreensis]